MDLKDLRVNGKRLQGSLEKMAKIGATPGGGVQRLTLTDEDKQARDLFVKWLQALNLEIIVDEMGNIFGKRPGKNNDLPPVMSGSHIDSQPKGGRFDGILGVMGPLEVLRTLHENNVETERPIVIVDWTNEEGSRFAPAMVASGVWAGALERSGLIMCLCASVTKDPHPANSGRFTATMSTTLNRDRFWKKKGSS